MEEETKRKQEQVNNYFEKYKNIMNIIMFF